jgi:hypothetical protein
MLTGDKQRRGPLGLHTHTCTRIRHITHHTHTAHRTPTSPHSDSVVTTHSTPKHSRTLQYTHMSHPQGTYRGAVHDCPCVKQHPHSLWMPTMARHMKWGPARALHARTHPHAPTNMSLLACHTRAMTATKTKSPATLCHAAATETPTIKRVRARPAKGERHSPRRSTQVTAASTPHLRFVHSRSRVQQSPNHLHMAHLAGHTQRSLPSGLHSTTHHMTASKTSLAPPDVSPRRSATMTKGVAQWTHIYSPDSHSTHTCRAALPQNAQIHIPWLD